MIDKEFDEALERIKTMLQDKKQAATMRRTITRINAEIAKHYADNKDTFERTKYLTINKFIRDLEAAVKIKQGYYKNQAGEHYFVRGIEVDGRCDLFRSGYNGEDRGVFVHITLASDDRIMVYDLPISVILYKFTASCEKKYRLQPCSKEDFDKAFQRIVDMHDVIPEVCEDPAPVLAAYKGYDSLAGKLRSYIAKLCNVKSVDDCFAVVMAKFITSKS